jgi:hypothetical protein
METVCKHCGHFEFYYQITQMANGNTHNGQYCQNCGRWQKWVSQQKEKDPYQAKFYRGKYKDCNVMEICKSDPSYCKWLYENRQEFKISWLKEYHITALELGLEL